ncbi:hypothetical protein KSP40_PGU009936 [Platanthera guangdongensis]|uniref:Uncharacterized protein n=1 Tax=Platanthera guangdongensis TaxID=2320717 RepID=A0ABR2LF12_9ASPA
MDPPSRKRRRQARVVDGRSNKTRREQKTVVDIDGKQSRRKQTTGSMLLFPTGETTARRSRADERRGSRRRSRWEKQRDSSSGNSPRRRCRRRKKHTVSTTEKVAEPLGVDGKPGRQHDGIVDWRRRGKERKQWPTTTKQQGVDDGNGAALVDRINDRLCRQEREPRACPLAACGRKKINHGPGGGRAVALSKLKVRCSWIIVGDYKEGYYIGVEVLEDDPQAEKPFYGPNQWPSEGKALEHVL